MNSLLFSLDLFQAPCRAETSGPPVIVEQPQDILAELDKPMALHCRAESNSLDDLRVNWYKDGRLVTMDPNARIITEFMALHVINTMPQDAGAYYCVAENSHGRTQSRIAKVQFISKENIQLIIVNDENVFFIEQNWKKISSFHQFQSVPQSVNESVFVVNHQTVHRHRLFTGQKMEKILPFHWIIMILLFHRFNRVILLLIVVLLSTEFNDNHPLLI